MSEAFDLGYKVGSAITQGVQEWRAIQRDRQERKEFDGVVALVNQRRAQIRESVNPETDRTLRQYQNLAQRYPDAEVAARGTGGVADDGSPETEQVLKTPEGDIPLGQVMALRMQKMQTDTNQMVSDLDLIMEMQARYPENRYVKQWAAQSYLSIQQKQQLQAKQFEAQRIKLDERKLQLERDKFAQEQQQYTEQPGREQTAQTFQTDEGIRRDAARIQAQKKADLEVEGVKAQNKTPPQPSEFQRKLQFLAPRAQQALDVIASLDYDRTSMKSGAESLLPRALQSGQRQQLEQAQLQFVDAILRAESGATVTQDEVKRNVPKYFEQAGDSPEVVEQKRRAREVATSGVFDAAGLQREEKAGARNLPRSPDDVRAAFKAGKLTREQARDMLRTMGR